MDVEEGGKETCGVRCLLTAAAGAEKDLVSRSKSMPMVPGRLEEAAVLVGGGEVEEAGEAAAVSAAAAAAAAVTAAAAAAAGVAGGGEGRVKIVLTVTGVVLEEVPVGVRPELIRWTGCRWQICATVFEQDQTWPTDVAIDGNPCTRVPEAG